MHAQAAGSMLRVTCGDDAAGAGIRIDGKFKGECPLDIQLPEGSHNLLVVKPTDESHEGFFEQDIRMGDGVVKKVEVPKLDRRTTAKGAKLEELKFQSGQKHAEKGDTDAMQKLGDLYRKGLGVQQDYAQAFKWYLRAAEAGNEYSMCYVVEGYSTGLGVEKNEEQLVTWSQKVLEIDNRQAEAGDIQAMNSLGWEYLGSCGVAKNLELSKFWFQKRAEALHKAADGGDYGAMLQMAYSYSMGTGVVRDQEQSNFWMEKYEATVLKAAKAGDDKAMLSLANHDKNWKEGWRGGKLKDEYLYWFRKAAEKGNAEAKDEMDIQDKLKKLGFHE